MEPRGKERGVIGSWVIQIRDTIAARSAQLVPGVGRTTERVGSVISRTEVLHTGRLLNPKGWAREVMEKLRGDPHSEPLTDTWTSDFLSREGEGREVIGERLRDKTVPWQAQRRLMQAVTNSFPCGAHLHRMGLRAATSAHHHCWQQVQREIAVASPESKGWNFLTLEGEQSMQFFLDEDVSGIVPTDNSHRSPSTGNDG